MNKELILKEARDWLSCEQEGQDINKNEKFIAWINENEEHKRLFEEEKYFRDKVFSLPNEYKEKISQKTKQELKSERVFNKFKVLVPLAASIMLVLALFIFESEKEIYKKEYFTTNKISEYKMPDNSKITLDAKSKIKVAFSDEKREITLEEGKAVFDVVSNKTRPFLVRNGKILVHVIGTKFEVNRKKSNTKISVLEGLVAIRYGRDENSKLIARLEKGDVLDMSKLGEVLSQKKKSIDKIALWEQQKLVFNQTPLNDVIKQFSKYSLNTTQLKVNCDDTYPITGEFGVYDLEKFLEYLPLIYPIKIEKKNGKIEVHEKKEYICHYL